MEGINGQNLVQIDPNIRKVNFLVNGRDKTYKMERKELTLIGVRCDGECLEVIEEVETEDEERLWSNPDSWTSGKVPVEGDDVEVETGWKMIYDAGESPILTSLTINGVLIFSDDADQTLTAKAIFVRAGEFHIGSEDEPY
mmetsp:Transcript_29160/g.43935  ORF Transcript_29160/g.43935 Transcript_29160/m.43935 type:complete len:141 (-) Transcript_29160:3417-3839(-)